MKDTLKDLKAQNIVAEVVLSVVNNLNLFQFKLRIVLSPGFKELPANGALLLYISADGCFGSTKHPEDSKLLSNKLKIKYFSLLLISINIVSFFHLVGYDLGGVVTNSKREADHSNKKGAHSKDMHW